MGVHGGRGKGPGSHLVLHLNRAMVAIDSLHVKVEDLELPGALVGVPGPSPHTPQPALGACSSPACSVLPSTGAKVLLQVVHTWKKGSRLGPGF